VILCPAYATVRFVDNQTVRQELAVQRFRYLNHNYSIFLLFMLTDRAFRLQGELAPPCKKNQQESNQQSQQEKRIALKY